MSIAQKYPTIAPSLNLDFANVKQLDPRITFTRASTATYYDGKTVAKAEENLLRQSQTFDVTTGGWAKVNATVTANTATAPDGTSTADTLDEGTATAAHTISQIANLAANTQYVFSCFAKDVNGTYLVLSLRGASSNIAAAEFNISTGALSKTYQIGTGFSVDSTSIVNVGNGWYRCIVVATVGSSVSSQANYIGMSDGSAFTVSGTPSYTGTNRTILIWGAQLEQRSAVTAYTPTTTQPITNYIPQLLSAAANVARFEHNPVTGESLGLEIEEQRTNLLTYSEQFDNAAWTKANTTITANTIVAPDGTLSGDTLVEDTANTTHFVGRNYTTTAADHTLSIYVKAAGRSRLILAATTDTRGVGFDLSTGTTFTQSYTANQGTGTITAVGNGWYRCTMTWTATVVSNGIRIVLNNGSGQIYTGDGYSGIYIWGAQLEAGAFPTSYIPTVAAQVTRSADAASMTGTNFSSWYRQDEGTLYAEAQTVSLSGSRGIFAIGDSNLAFGSANTIYSIFSGAVSGRILENAIVNGSSQVTIAPTYTQSANTATKTAQAYKVNDYAITVNAANIVADTVALVPEVSSLSIGSLNSGWAGGANFLNGTIKKIAYYPQRLTNGNLQALTS